MGGEIISIHSDAFDAQSKVGAIQVSPGQACRKAPVPSYREPAGNSVPGFTLVEILVALAVGALVLTGIVRAFIGWQDGYRSQIRTAGLQQNLRTAMDFICSDIRMAGFLSGIDPSVYLNYIDWDPAHSGADDVVPFLHGADNVTGIDRYRDNSDIIVIVKGGREKRRLKAGEGVSAGDRRITLGSLDLDDDGDDDLNATGKKLGILAAFDLNMAQLFRIETIDGGGVVVEDSLDGAYREGDFISRLDVIVYRIDDRNAAFDGALLERKNFGNGGRFQVVAENIVDLQIRYFCHDGSWIEDPSNRQDEVKAVEVVLRAQAPLAGRRPIVRSLESMVFIRNRLL